MTSSYGVNVGAFEAAHPAWKLSAGFDGAGYIARRRDAPAVHVAASTLDELAEIIREVNTRGNT